MPLSKIQEGALHVLAEAKGDVRPTKTPFPKSAYTALVKRRLAVVAPLNGDDLLFQITDTGKKYRDGLKDVG